ncbi:MAG: 3-deoxy-manno-octulosonate cytidylyltransferase [Pseudomonadota bacterium]
MSANQQTLIMIPARLQSTRLPNKSLLPIGSMPMLWHCWRQACKANIGEVVIAAGDQKIATTMQHLGAQVILTDPNLQSGSDRIWQAFQKNYKMFENIKFIVNMQGDLPFINPNILTDCLNILKTTKCDITTPVTKIKSTDELEAPQTVKVAIGGFKSYTGQSKHISHARALYFSRNIIPANAGPHYHHVGVYAWQLNALERFVKLEQSTLEKREKLEQLRALEAGMHIEAVEVDETPAGVDTLEDYQKICNFWENHKDQFA